MTTYPKIQAVFKRDPETKKFLTGQYSLPEFLYLADNKWLWTEKVDGMNIRVMYEYPQITFAGRTDKAQFPIDLLEYLQATFTLEKLNKQFPGIDADVCLYGEGYGAGIQKGSAYRKDKGFILFDVKIGRWWLLQEDVVTVAEGLKIPHVPIIGIATLTDAINMIKDGVPSTLKDGLAEGMVGEPLIPMFNRRGDRIITKLKHKDFIR